MITGFIVAVDCLTFLTASCYPSEYYWNKHHSIYDILFKKANKTYVPYFNSVTIIGPL